jgi:hypothetical protein
MNVISEESPEFITEAMRLERNMTFGDIPKEERVLIFKVDRDDSVIQKIYDKVAKARLFLAEFEQTHLNFNNKS